VAERLRQPYSARLFLPMAEALRQASAVRANTPIDKASGSALERGRFPTTLLPLAAHARAGLVWH
jgi:hypothetical protein